MRRPENYREELPWLSRLVALGKHHRTTRLVSAMETKITQLKPQYSKDLANDKGWCEVPFGRKAHHAGRQLRWQWFFPTARNYGSFQTPYETFGRGSRQPGRYFALTLQGQGCDYVA